MSMAIARDTIRNGEAADVTIPAKYENGVFKPLEDVKLTEGTRVEVQIPDQQPRRRPKSVREYAAFGMGPIARTSRTA